MRTASKRAKLTSEGNGCVMARRTARQWSRTGLRSGLGLAGTGMLVAVLAGCGGNSSGGEVTPVGGSGGNAGGPTATMNPGGGSGGAPPTSPVANGPVTSPTSGSQAAATSLKIVYNDGAGQVSTWTLTCDPTGGTHPHAALACQTLAHHGKAGFATLPRGVMCPQIFSGAQTAVITGTWNGTKVDTTFNRANGCQTGRWRALQGLLPNVPVNGAM